MSGNHPTADADIGRRVAVSAGYMILGRLSSRAVGVVSSIVLARLLTPADFGVVGLAMLVLGTMDMLTQSSIGLVLIRITAPEPRHYDTAWTLAVLRGLVVAGLMVATADLQAWWFGDTRIAPVIWLIAVTYTVQSLASARMVDLERNLQFRRLYLPGLIGRLITFVVSISVSIIFRNYWALVLGNFAGTVYWLVIGYWMAPYRPKLSLECWREFFSFTKWLGLNNIFTMLDNQLPTFVIGSHDGVAAVGRYQMAAQVAALPASEIAAPIRQPAYSGLSRLREDLAMLRSQFIGQLALVFAIIAPLSLGLWVSAPWTVRVVLGQQWTDAVTLLEFCAIWTLLDAIAHHAQMIFVVVARQRFYVLMNGSLIMLRVATVLGLGYYGGVNWVAGGMAATAGVSLLVSLWFALPAISATWSEFMRPAWRSLIAAAVMSAGVLILRTTIPSSDEFRTDLMHLLAAIGLGGVLYLGTLLGLWLLVGRPSGPERQIVDAALGFARRWAWPLLARPLGRARGSTGSDTPPRTKAR